jgi:hypothetical protein
MLKIGKSSTCPIVYWFTILNVDSKLAQKVLTLLFVDAGFLNRPIAMSPRLQTSTKEGGRGFSALQSNGKPPTVQLTNALRQQMLKEICENAPQEI